MSARPRRKGWAPYLLSAGCLVLAAIIILDLRTELAPQREANAAAEPLSAAGASASQRPATAMRPLEAYAEIVARPLFSASRRPPPQPVAAAPRLEHRRLPAVLVGILISSTERIALIELGTPSQVMRVTEGQQIESWQVQRIEFDRLVLRSGDAIDEIKLIDKPPASASPSGRPGARLPAVPPPVVPKPIAK